MKKRDLKNSELIKTETKFIKSRLLAYLFIKASTEVSFVNLPLPTIIYDLHGLIYAYWHVKVLQSNGTN